MILDQLVRYIRSVGAIIKEMFALKKQHSSFSVEDMKLVPCIVAVIFFAPIPPLARFLKRKLLGDPPAAPQKKQRLWAFMDL